ncbi:MAG TPA: alpha/beta fold hydrolase [Rhodocyclaceae bacterium]|nr:alpha/beta fold hydrolase [Rhodocyclaceae bacterium]
MMFTFAPLPADPLARLRRRLGESARRYRQRTRLAFATLGLLLASCSWPGDPRLEVAPPASAEYYSAADGQRLPIRRWPTAQRPRAVVVAVHGFNDYSQSFDEVARHFATAGIQTVAYDQRGFGAAPARDRWAGTDLLVADFLGILAQVGGEHPDLPLYVLGESLGGSVAAIALQDADAPPIAGLILVTPAVWSRSTMPWYQRFAIWIGDLASPALTLSSAAFDIAPSDNPEVQRRHHRDPLIIKTTRLDKLSGLSDLMDQAAPAIAGIRQRTLLLYGLRDVMMPRRPMIALFENWPARATPNFRFALYPDGYHTLLRDLQRRVVWDDLLSWIERPAASLPSGFERRREDVLKVLRSAPPATAPAAGCVAAGPADERAACRNDPALQPAS